MDFRRRRRTRYGKRKHRKHRKTRKLLTIKPPNKEIDFSPISSPGSFNDTLSPNTPPNTPITRRAKELAALYPNRASMLARSKSFNTEGINNETFYREFERLFPNRNGPSYP
jgi:hypothetical protein